MKKTFLLILSLILCLFSFGCQQPSNEDGDENEPKYSSVYEFNDTHHWKTLESGEGEPIDEYGEHIYDSGKCKYCNFYYDVSEFFEFIKVGHVTPGQNNYEWAYKVNRFYGDRPDSPVHIKIPTTYNGEKVISIASYLFNINGEPENYYNQSESGSVTSPISGNKLNVPIESIIIPEGIIFIGRSAFNGTRIKELVIPDSVVGGYGEKIGNLPTPEKANYNVENYYWPLRNICGDCTQLERVVLGEGVTHLGGYAFSLCKKLNYIKFGSKLEAIAMRAFYECTELKTVVIPKSLVYLPEGDVPSPAVENKKVSITQYFKYASNIYLEITEEELKSLEKPKYQRDSNGNVIEDGIDRNPGYCEGWSAMAKLHFVGEWYYDDYGNPVAY